MQFVRYLDNCNGKIYGKMSFERAIKLRGEEKRGEESTRHQRMELKEESNRDEVYRRGHFIL